MTVFPTLLESSAWGVLVVRVVLGIIFLVHGKGKFGMWKMQPSEQMPSGMINMMKFLSIAETLGGVALILGLLTQLAALGVGIIMIGAIYFKVFKWKVPFADTAKNGWEFDLALLAMSFLILLTGPGMWAIDRLF